MSSVDMVAYNCTCIRSSMDYACQVFHYALPNKHIRTDLEQIQKRAMQCILPNLPYPDALAKVRIKSV